MLGAQLRSQSKEKGLDAHVTFIDAVPFEDLPSYFSLADLLVFPSTSDKECMGLSIKQAMACSRPVVVARAGGAAEAVEDGVTGYCIGPNDSEQLLGDYTTARIRAERGDGSSGESGPRSISEKKRRSQVLSRCTCKRSLIGTPAIPICIQMMSFSPASSGHSSQGSRDRTARTLPNCFS